MNHCNNHFLNIYITAKQAVAIRSEVLRLPSFQFYPNVDTKKYALGGLANKIVERDVSKLGTQVSFFEFLAFEARYFANNEYTPCTPPMTCSFRRNRARVQNGRPIVHDRRINRALEIFRLFQK